MCLLLDDIILLWLNQNAIKYCMEDNIIVEESTVTVDDTDLEQQKEQQNILLLLLDVIE